MTQSLIDQRPRGELVAELYDRHAAGLFAYCHDQLGDTASAADALTAVFTGVPVVEPPRAALYALARREIYLRDVAYVLPSVDPAADPAAALVERVLREVRPHQREVLLLAAICGLDTAELAWVLDVAADTAEQLELSARHRFSHSLAAAVAAVRSGAALPARQADAYAALAIAPAEDALARLPWRRPSGGLRVQILSTLPDDPRPAGGSLGELRTPGGVPGESRTAGGVSGGTRTSGGARADSKRLWPTTPRWPLPLAEPNPFTNTGVFPAKELSPPEPGHRSRHEAATEPMPKIRTSPPGATDALPKLRRRRSAPSPTSPAAATSAAPAAPAAPTASAVAAAPEPPASPPAPDSSAVPTARRHAAPAMPLAAPVALPEAPAALSETPVAFPETPAAFPGTRTAFPDVLVASSDVSAFFPATPTAPTAPAGPTGPGASPAGGVPAVDGTAVDDAPGPDGAPAADSAPGTHGAPAADGSPQAGRDPSPDSSSSFRAALAGGNWPNLRRTFAAEPPSAEPDPAARPAGATETPPAESRARKPKAHGHKAVTNRRSFPLPAALTTLRARFAPGRKTRTDAESEAPVQPEAPVQALADPETPETPALSEIPALPETPALSETPAHPEALAQPETLAPPETVDGPRTASAPETADRPEIAPQAEPAARLEAAAVSDQEEPGTPETTGTPPATETTAATATGTRPRRHDRPKPIKLGEHHYDWLWELAGFILCVAIAMIVFFAVPTIVTP